MHSCLQITTIGSGKKEWDTYVDNDSTMMKHYSAAVGEEAHLQQIFVKNLHIHHFVQFAKVAITHVCILQSG